MIVINCKIMRQNVYFIYGVKDIAWGWEYGWRMDA